MGSSLSNTRCDSRQQPGNSIDKQFMKDSHIHMEAPPTLQRPMSFEEKVYAKFKKEPLVPIGCAATAYFLVSGIKSFKNRDPRRAQKMMRARVGAQFATLAIFVYYVGFDNVNFDIAPAYYNKKKAEEQIENEE